MRLIFALTLTVFSAPALLAQTAEVDATDGKNSLGKLPCAILESAQLSLCAYEALKQGEPKVTVRVLLPGGDVRYIYFEDGEPTSTNATSKMTSNRQDGTIYVSIDPTERYEIPESLLLATGG
ncbi:MAG: hypothetical protein JKY94_14985 [Rhodobacteraceae bacterium]|nr:hypothetical protein [Paracoccaceae bacterium]